MRKAILLKLLFPLCLESWSLQSNGKLDNFEYPKEVLKRF